MKKSLMALFVAVVLSAAAIAQTKAGTATLQGYDVGEYKVNASIERQITAKVVKPIEAALSAIPNGKISITVYGYADRKTGTVGTNDEKGDKRAGAVATELKIKFPNANVISTTRGNMIDSRMVIVDWKVATINPAPSSPRQGLQSITFLVVGFAVIALIALIIARFAKAQRGDQLQPVEIPRTQTAEEAPVPPAVSASAVREPKWVSFKSGAYDCEALITPRDDGWLSPFTINGKPIFSPTERGIIKSLRGSMVQKEFKDQPGQIIAAGKFRIKGWAS